jgi:dipeptidyl aminopeptidase/acylaminoacyl peptidase
VTLRGWFVQRADSRRVLIKVHGRYGDRTNYLELNRPLWEKGYNLLMFDLRGHGLSDGERFSYCYNERYDIVAAVDFLKKKGFKPESIGIIGWSMGASCSLMGMELAPDIKAGIFDSAYGDLGRVGQNQLGGFLLPVYWGATTAAHLFWGMDIDEVKPEKAIANLGGRKVMLIHGDKDSLVPVSEAYYMLKAAGGDKTVADFWIVPGAVHVGAYFLQPAVYLQRISRFFDGQLVK